MFAQSKISASYFFSDPVSKKIHHAYDNSFAIVIGIDDYKETEPRLSSVTSSEKIQNLLITNFGFSKSNIFSLNNDKARLNVILDVLKKIRSTNKLDRVLFYFSGRAHTFNDDNKNNIERGFLIPYGANLSSNSSVSKTCLSLDTLKKYINAIGAKHSLVLIDANVGGLPVAERFGNLPPIRTQLDKFFSGRTIQIFVGADRYEILSDRVRSEPSVFANTFIELLEKSTGDKNNDGVITATEIVGQVMQSVIKQTIGKIHPQFGYMVDNGGDFPFILPDLKNETQITFSVKPVDAEIYLDSILLKDVKDQSKISVKGVDYHRLEIKRNGYLPKKMELFTNGRNQISVSAELEKIMTADLVIKTNVPGAKVFIDGKFIGQPEKMLLLENFPRGEYTILGEAPGYFSDSTKIKIDRTARFTASLNLKSRNGFLTVTSNPKVKIYLNNNLIGREKILRRLVPPGQYTLRISGIGYETVEKFFVLKDNENLSFDIPLTRPDKLGTIWRSSLMPGWGQMYAQRFGWHYPVLQVGAVGATGYFYSKMMANDTKYKDVKIVYDDKTVFRTDSTWKVLRDSMTTLGDATLSSYNFFLASVVTASSIYVWNFLDVLLNDPEDDFRRMEQDEIDLEEQKNKKEIEKKVSLYYDNGPRLNLKITF